MGKLKNKGFRQGVLCQESSQAKGLPKSPCLWGERPPFYGHFEGAFLVYCVYLLSGEGRHHEHQKRKLSRRSAAVQVQNT